MNEFYSNNQFSSIDLCFKRVWLNFNRLEVLLLCCITIFANFWVAQSDDGASPRMAGTAENGADSLEPPAEGARPTEVAIESWSSFVLKVDWAGFQPILLTEPNTKAGDWKVSCFVDVFFCVCLLATEFHKTTEILFLFIEKCFCWQTTDDNQSRAHEQQRNQHQWVVMATPSPGSPSSSSSSSSSSPPYSSELLRTSQLPSKWVSRGDWQPIGCDLRKPVEFFIPSRAKSKKKESSGRQDPSRLHSKVFFVC